MERVKDCELPEEEYDIFRVTQLTRDTELQHTVAVDYVVVPRWKVSEVHRHNNAETVLFILSGSGEVIVGEEEMGVKKGDRVRIGKGIFHGVRTDHEELVFISVQSPPILDKASGALDLEPLKKEVRGGRNA